MGSIGVSLASAFSGRLSGLLTIGGLRNNHSHMVVLAAELAEEASVAADVAAAASADAAVAVPAAGADDERAKMRAAFAELVESELRRKLVHWCKRGCGTWARERP
jgi:hypothetical protein